MGEDTRNPFAAGEQGLGYIYQPRLALLEILDIPESNSMLIEQSDDLEFSNDGGRKSLASLKHKAVGTRLTDLSVDFWKSVRIWLAKFNTEGKSNSDLRFFLFTTSSVDAASFLRFFLPKADRSTVDLTELAAAALSKTKSAIVSLVKSELEKLDGKEQENFLQRITIFDNSPRITDVPSIIIEKHLRTVRREYRLSVFERLEGWWNDTIIKMLAGERTEPVYGYEVSDKLSAITDEYRSDNLPINFRNKMPDGNIDVESDSRIFVYQLKCIEISPTRVQSAIIDYYRAFEQRSSWARENLLVSGEIDDYEDCLASEWARYRDVIFEELDEDSTEEALIEAGKRLYKWAEFDTERFRIRERVTEPYVVRGGFHILANARPEPKVHWHPQFLDRLKKLLGKAA